MKTFHLPDLGEGLPDAEIVEWLVKEGDEVTLDQPMISMETAKAIVEVPSPFTGRIVRFHGQAGDVIKTGAPLAEFEVEGDDSPSAEPPKEASDQDSASTKTSKRDDSGTVVGNVEAGNEVLQEHLSSVGEFKMTPAVRALAKKLKVNPAHCTPSGKGGVITAADVKKAAADGPKTTTTKATTSRPSAKPSSTQATGEWEPLRGTRRTMARAMSESHQQVVPTTLMDDADIQAWASDEDITARLLRALWAGAQVEPGLNAWFDGDNGVRMVHKSMHVGVAVDTPEGLLVAALRDVNQKDRSALRQDINRLRDNATNRSIPADELKDYTIVLSNFGKFAGRYATPVITPPCVTIVAAGKLRHEVVPVLGGVEVHRMMPLSLTFDHRACTGGEAARFLQAMLKDLALPH
ncbi:MAG TPA: dihydrolipoamide acetyltransferase family protein [Wenzhouxiangella sp.]